MKLDVAYIDSEDLSPTLAGCFVGLNTAPSYVTFSAVVDHTLRVLEGHSFDTLDFALKLRESLDTFIAVERITHFK